VSRLRYGAAALVSRVRTQALAARLPGSQDDGTRIAAWGTIDDCITRLMDQIHALEPVIDALEDYRESSRLSLPALTRAQAQAAAAKRLLDQIEIYSAVTGTQLSSTPAAEGFARPADVQLPIGDRDPDPAATS
jgi:hypothetical protein